jgi:transposase
MNAVYYIGLDIHKKSITFVIKTHAGQLVQRGSVDATRPALTEWANQIDHPWIGALEATMFSGWVYDQLRPHAHELQVAHPLLLKAITCAKKKNDRLDADKICDLLRCDLLPRCYMAPSEIRELRRVMRYRNMMMRQAVRMKNKIAGLLMEVGEPYVKEKLHRKKYFHELLDELEARDKVPASVRDLLALSRGQMEACAQLERKLLAALEQHAKLKQRVARLRTIDGVGVVVALTWALEVGEPERFGSVRKAVSNCGLCAAQKQSAGKDQRGPLSKQRNKHLQCVLIEAAKLAPRYNQTLAAVHERELKRGARNRATVAVARKLVAYLLAVDRREDGFKVAPDAA